jgi:two-component sensor histidine kinase/competence protein ComGC
MYLKLLKLVIFTTLFLVVLLKGKAQTPSHFILGEEALSGIDIYDIVQDSKHNYWLATDNGLIKYDGYAFKKIICKEAFSNSVFDLQLDYNNNVFCKNLSGQIFRVNNDSCEIYFQVPDSLMSSEVYYSFDNHNNLIIVTHSIFKINDNNKIELIEGKEYKNSYTELFKLKDSSLLIHGISSNQLITLENEKIVKKKISDKVSGFALQFFYLNNKLFFCDKKSGNLLKRDNDRFSIDDNFTPIRNKNERLRYYSNNENLWVSRQAGGVLVFDQNFKPLFEGKTIFRNNIISCTIKDNEGNILLGTFGEGLIVIPNVNLINTKMPTISAKITRITSSPNNTIFLGSQDGRIYQIDQKNNISTIWNHQNKNIEILEYFEENNSLLIDDKIPVILHLNSKKEQKKYWGAIKDVNRISKNKYMISSNRGVIYYYPISTTTKKINLFSERTNSIGYDANTKTIYAGTASGLKIGNEEIIHNFKLNRISLICRDIMYFNEKIYVATSKNGILIFKNNKLIDNWKIESGLISNTIKHIKKYEKNIFVSTDNGIQLLNQNGESLYILNKSNGLQNNNITDFEIRNNVLWLIHQRGVQSINIKHLVPYVYTPTINLRKILVNDSINTSIETSTFNYQQNKFEFYVSASSLKYKDEISYHHQLIGIDNGWQINSYINNKIEYKSLPPGNYTFKIKAICRNIESKTISYQFIIAPPLWNTWWFYLIVILIFIAITFFIFKQEIKKQKKKIQLKNELNASKLIAIQSQMNPHFIFNAINSIQDLILKGDIDNSYSYIIKFSKLVRQTLNFSDKEFIDIEAEIELLEIYLGLEKLRFKDDFEYSITCEANDIQVPPMLIQPFVENAIKHGLLHKEGIKKLDITFNKTEILHCTIRDNGIGRKKAQEIKDRQQKNHQSFSVNATRSRFEIMKSHYQQDLGVQFEDLIEKGEPNGTIVVITMPFKQKY